MKIREITVSLRCHETWLLCLHEKYAYKSIPMLWCKDLFFWSKTQTMRKMSKNLEYSNQKTWSTSRQNASCFVGTNLSATANACQVEPAALSHPSRLELPVPQSSAKVRPKKIYSKIPQRSIDPLGRWNLVLVQKSTMDSSSGGPQTDQRPSCHLFGSFVAQRPRKPERMDTIHQNDSFQSQKSHLRRRMRQFSQFQKVGSTKSLGTSTVSFSFNPSIPIQKRTLEARNWASRGSRINLSTGSSSPRASQWKATSSCPQPLGRTATSSTYNSTSNAYSRILEKHRLLSEFSNSSVIESSFNYQYHRIDESINPRSHAPMRQSTNSRIASTLDNSFYTYAT